MKITAQVENFEMDGITFQGVPMGFDIDKDSIDTSEITDKTREVTDAAKEFDDGADALKDGTSEDLDGSRKLTDGTKSLSLGAEQLAAGLLELKKSVDSLASSQSGAKLQELLNGLVQFVIRTDEIKVEEAEETEETTQRETVWDRVKALF